MDTGRLRARLAANSVAGRYDLFIGVGLGLALLGLIFFLRALVDDASAHRAWHLFQSTGCTSPGSPAAAWRSRPYTRS